VSALFEDSELCSVFPLNDSGKKWSVPRSAPIGINDSFHVIAPEARQSPEVEAFAVTSAVEERGGRPLYLEMVDPVLITTIQRIDPRCNCFVDSWETNPRVDLPAQWDSYLDQLNAKQRARLRREVRRADEGNMTFRYLDEPDAVAESTKRSLLQRRRVWSDSGLFDDVSPSQKNPRWDEFLIDAARSLAASGLALSGELLVEGKVVAAGLLLRREDRLLGYHRSSERSPMRFGAIFDALSIRVAIERGVRVMEFGRGAEDYKYHFGVVDQPLCNVLVGHLNAPMLGAIGTLKAPPLLRRLVPGKKG
jgi:CelD/BcsL family acetyltransferase involved in cellulose biosynthesis